MITKSMNPTVRMKLECIVNTAARLQEEHSRNAEESKSRRHDWLDGWYTGRGAVYGLVGDWIKEILELQDSIDSGLEEE